MRERSDAEILLEAQERALEILTAARQEAERHRAGGREAAAALLLQQQKKAEELLRTQRQGALRTTQLAQTRADEAPAEERGSILSTTSVDADALLDRQFLAAETLRSSELQYATETHDAVERGAVEVLLKAHREAAAVLLEARMAIEERRQRRDQGRSS